MLNLLDNLPVTSIIAVIVVIVGGVIAIVNPSTLSFTQYCIDIGISGGGLGGLGIARSLAGKGVAPFRKMQAPPERQQ